MSLGDNDRALGRVVAEAEFAARLPPAAAAYGDIDVDAALGRFADGAGTPLRIERHSDKGIGRVVDVRKSLRSIERFEDERVRARLDWADGELVRFRVTVSHEGSARPIEVLSALFGADVAPRAEIARAWGCGRRRLDRRAAIVGEPAPPPGGDRGAPCPKSSPRSVTAADVAP